MINVPENELFSAYLDGELTAEEQADVEQLLATSPAARQLLEELRTLSAGLQALPVERLEEDLSERVLREAERRILAGQPGPRSGNGSEREGKSARGSRFRRFFRPRTFLWSALAVAVAVMLSLRERPAERDRVAQAPKAPPSVQSVEEPARPVRQPEPQATAPQTPTPPAAVVEATAPESIAAAEPAGETAPAEPGRPHTAAAALDEASGKAAVDAAPAPRMLKSVPAPAAAAEQSPAAETPPPAAMASDAAAEPEKPAASPEAVAQEPAPAEAVAPEAKSEESKVETLIVHCDVSPEVFHEKLFDRILAERKVNVVQTPVGEDDEQESGQAVQLADPVEIQTYYLEVTSQEIAALMNDLRSRPDEFRSLKAESNRAVAANSTRGAPIGGQSLSPRSSGGRATMRLGPSAAPSGGVSGDAANGVVSASPSAGGATGTVTPKASGGVGFRSIGVQAAPAKADAADKKQPGGKAPQPNTFRVRFVLRAIEAAAPTESPATDER